MFITHRSTTDIPAVTCNGTPIKTVTQARLLGVIVDDQLSWREHVNHLYRKIARKIGALRRSSRQLTPTARRQFFVSVIQPDFEYARLNVCANHVNCTEEPLARSVEESNSLHCGCHLAMRSWPSVSWAPVVQHWTSLGSPAGPDGAKMSFGHSPARHLQETKAHKTFSWNKGKSILFHTFSPSHYIWLSLFSPIVLLLSGTLFLNLFVRAHLIPPLNLTFLDFILKSRSILAFSLIRHQHLTQLRWACT